MPSSLGSVADAGSPRGLSALRGEDPARGQAPQRRGQGPVDRREAADEREQVGHPHGLEHGLVDELGGLRAAVRKAKVLAGLDEDDKVRLVSYPGSSVGDYLRPRPSSQPAAASLPDALGALITRSVVGIVEHAERSLTGASVLWVGQSRY